MPDQTLTCIETGPGPARLVHVVAASGLPAMLESLPPAQRDFVAGSGFNARAGELVLLPGPQGVEAALFGTGAASGPHVFGALPFALPEGVWQFAPATGASPTYDAEAAVLGFCL